MLGKFFAVIVCTSGCLDNLSSFSDLIAERLGIGFGGEIAHDASGGSSGICVGYDFALLLETRSS